MSKLKEIVEEAFERRGKLDAEGADAAVKSAVEEVMEGLDTGNASSAGEGASAQTCW